MAERRQLWQDGVMVADVIAPTKEQADAEIQHYAMWSTARMAGSRSVTRRSAGGSHKGKLMTWWDDEMFEGYRDGRDPN